MFKIKIEKGKHSNVHANPQRRGGRPVVSSNSYPSIIIDVKQNYDENIDGIDFDEELILDVVIEILGQRVKFATRVNNIEIQLNITIDAITEKFVLSIGSSFEIKVIVIDNFGKETISDGFQI